MTRQPAVKVEFRTLTLKMPEPVHKKLRIIAALREKNLTETIVELIQREPVGSPEEIAGLQSILHGATGDTQVKPRPKRKPAVEI